MRELHVAGYNANENKIISDNGELIVVSGVA